MWHRRALVAEAIVLIVVARILVKFVPFKRWRATLGRIDQGSDGADCGAPPPVALDCAASVERAAWRLPGTLCLPKSVALQWMLKRRRIAAAVLFAVKSHASRGGLDDLHAWVAIGAAALLDDASESQHVILRIRTDFGNAKQ